MTELEDDVFGAARRKKDDWDEAAYYSQRLAGALLETTCPRCVMRIGALVINSEPETTHKELECPACGHRWEEET